MCYLKSFAPSKTFLQGERENYGKEQAAENDNEYYMLLYRMSSKEKSLARVTE